jgi:hypothetical protein
MSMRNWRDQDEESTAGTWFEFAILLALLTLTIGSIVWQLSTT